MPSLSSRSSSDPSARGAYLCLYGAAAWWLNGFLDGASPRVRVCSMLLLGLSLVVRLYAADTAAPRGLRYRPGGRPRSRPA